MCCAVDCRGGSRFDSSSDDDEGAVFGLPPAAAKRPPSAQQAAHALHKQQALAVDEAQLHDPPGRQQADGASNGKRKKALPGRLRKKLMQDRAKAGGKAGTD